MIYVKKNSENTYKSEVDQYEYYLYEFVSGGTCDNFTAIFNNTSFDCDNPTISIDEVCEADVDVTQGMVNFSYVGYWTANIYGNPDDSNLDPVNATFLETQDLKVYLVDCDSCKTC